MEPPNYRPMIVFIVIVAVIAFLAVRCDQPPDAPPDPGPRLVCVVYESLDQQAPVQALIARPHIEALGHEFRIIDDDVTTGLDTVPQEVAEHISAATAHGLPALTVGVNNGIRVGPLPATRRFFRFPRRKGVAIRGWIPP